MIKPLQAVAVKVSGVGSTHMTPAENYYSQETLDQLTQDLATAQAEIARLSDTVKSHIDDLDRCIDVLEIHGLSKTAEEVKKAIGELTQALSQSSPSLQEYRDMKADAERYRYIRNTVSANYGKHDGYSFALPWLNTKVNLMKGSVAGHLDTAIDAIKGKSC